MLARVPDPKPDAEAVVAKLIEVVRDAGGTAVYGVVTLTDESSRWALEQALGENEARFRTLAEQVPEAVLLCDRILLFSSNPGRVADEIRVPFPHPRNRLDPAFREPASPQTDPADASPMSP